MQSKPSIVFWISAGKALVMFALTLMLMLLAVPRFVQILTDFETALPKPTQFIVNSSFFIQNNFMLLLLPMLGLGALFIWILIELDKRKQNAWILVLSFIPTILALLIIVPLFLPLLQTISVAE
ncbi:MAG: hypothetical protein ACPGJU_06145 [Coraliomargarita sp.]